jgi:glutamine amidotransferase
VISIIDYKAGNLASVAKALAHLGHEFCITSDPATVSRASKIVLPGVGHFSSTAELDRTGSRQAISHSIQRGVPFLGICVGMQWLYEGSEEAPESRGLGLLPGNCARFVLSVKSPHVGWNRLRVQQRSRLLDGLDDAFVYFSHSYRAPVTKHTCGVAAYGDDFAAAVECKNAFGVQFHPEKSGAAGLRLLRNFLELPC